VTLGAPVPAGVTLGAPTSTTTPPPTQPQGLGGYVNKYIEGSEEKDPNWQSPETGGMIGGAIKSAGRALATITDMVTPKGVDPTFERSYRAANPNAKPEDVKAAFEQAHPMAAAYQHHLQDASDWLKEGSTPTGFWEHVGALGEQALEYIGTDGLLKMAGPTAAAAGGVAQTAEKLKSIQQVHATLAANPKLAGLVMIGAKASREALLNAGQTYLHTEDPTQTAMGAVIGGGMGGAAEGASQLGEYLAGKGPVTRTIEGVDMPALQSQLNESGRLMEGGAQEAPKVAKAQQAAMPQVQRNVAARATANVLDDINKTRRFYEAPKLLPAPGGSEGYTFSLGTTPTVEEPTGTLVQRAEAVPTAERTAGTAAAGPQQGEIGSLAATVPERAQEGAQAFRKTSATGAELEAQTAAQSKIDQATIENLGIKKAQGKRLTGPENQELQRARAREASGTPTTEPRSEKVTGGAALTTKDPAEAQRWLSDRERLQQDPAYKQLSDSQRSQIDDEVDSLRDQLKMYHLSPPNQNRFQPIDVASIAQHVEGFDHAGAMIKNQLAPVFDRVNTLSDGQFNRWEQQIKDAHSILSNPASSEEAARNARSTIESTSNAVQDLFNRHGSDLAPGDLAAARKGYMQASKLEELHSLFQRMTNGVTRDQTKRGFQQVYVGADARQLDSWLSQGNNRKVLTNLIGQDGVDNITEMTQGLTQVGTARDTLGVVHDVGDFLMSRHGLGGSIAGSLAGLTGHSALTGISVGVTAAAISRMVLRYAVNNPEIGKLVSYAAKNRVAAKIYAPLISRAIMVSTQPPEKADQGATQ
jgi:hypothetical protein